MRKMKDVDELGKGYWIVWHEAPSGRLVSTMRVCSDIFKNKDATLEQLMEDWNQSPRNRTTPVDRFEWEEYVQEGRKVVRRVTKTMRCTQEV